MVNRLALGEEAKCSRAVEVVLRDHAFVVRFTIEHTGSQVQAAIRKMCADAGVRLDFDDHKLIYREICQVVDATQRPEHIEMRREIGQYVKEPAQAAA